MPRPTASMRENKVYGQSMRSRTAASNRAGSHRRWMQQVGASARERLIAAAAGALERSGIGVLGRVRAW